MRPGRPEPHTLAGAYALDALAGTDRTRFERHLARCEQCSQEISGLREARRGTDPAALPGHPRGCCALAGPARGHDRIGWLRVSRSWRAPARLGAEDGARRGRGRYGRRRAPRRGRRHRGAPGR